MDNLNESSSSDEDDEEFINDIKDVMTVAMVVVDAAAQLLMMEEEEEEFGKKKRRKEDRPRAKRRTFQHVAAYECIQRDHVGPDALFGQEVLLFFRLGRSRVEVLLQALGNSDNTFYQSFRRCRFGRMGASMEAKVLLPLRVLAYGTAPHNYSDYFQMSPSMARVCCVEFNMMIPKIFGDEYLRLPTPHDVRAICALHKEVHGVDGMLGSLDCMHTYWKNCPVAWQGAFLGRNSGPTIVLEAICDYNLFFWHLSYGYSGAMNDLNILNISPLLEKWTEGSFTGVEKDARVVPFQIGGETFDRTYVLVDGIYPKYSRFVRGHPQPVTDEETRFTKWQESARKDIERAFGVLQCKWKVLSFPLHTKNMDFLSSLVECCLVLHNMAVSDRVMGDATARYCPFDESEDDVPLAREEPTVMEDEPLGNDNEEEADEEEDGDEEEGDSKDDGRQEGSSSRSVTAVTTLREFEPILAATVAHRIEWGALKNDKEWSRLQMAIMSSKGKGM